jgi:nitroreductase
MIDLLRKRRSIRRYKPDRIEKKKIGLLAEALLRAPSSRDIQPCEFILVDNPELLDILASSKEHGSQFLDGAALGIVICADSTKSDVWIEDCSVASILVQMTAQSLGLGSCWIQIRNRDHVSGLTSEEYIQKTLGIPAHVRVDAIMSIGHPAEKRKPVPKAALRFEKIRHNSYSEPFSKASLPGKKRAGR